MNACMQQYSVIFIIATYLKSEMLSSLTITTSFRSLGSLFTSGYSASDSRKESISAAFSWMVTGESGRPKKSPDCSSSQWRRKRGGSRGWRPPLLVVSVHVLRVANPWEVLLAQYYYNTDFLPGLTMNKMCLNSCQIYST